MPTEELPAHQHGASSNTLSAWGSIQDNTSGGPYGIGSGHTVNISGCFSAVSVGGRRRTGYDWEDDNPTRIDFNWSGTPSISVSPTGGNAAHNNIQPYIVVYRYRRIS